MINAFLTLALSIYFFVKLTKFKENKGLNGFCCGIFLVIAICKLAPFAANMMQKCF